MANKFATILMLALLSFGIFFGLGIKDANAYLTPTSSPYGAEANAGIYFTSSSYDQHGGAGSLSASASVSIPGLTASGFASANLHSIYASLSGTGDIAGGYFYDTYTLQSTTLPVGTPDDVVITYDLEGQLSGTGEMVYYVYTGVPGQLGLDQAANGLIGNGTLDTGTQALDFDKQVGDSIVVEVDLSCYTVSGSCDVNDPLNVTSSNPGVTIVSAAQQAASNTTTTTSSTSSSTSISSSTSSTSSSTTASTSITTTTSTSTTQTSKVPEFPSSTALLIVAAVLLPLVLALRRLTVKTGRNQV